MLRKNKKIILIIFICILFIAALGSLGYFLYQKYEKEKFAEEIYSHYGENVQIINDAFLYNKDNQVVGVLYKDLTIELDKQLGKYDEYFKLKDNDYYVLYSDVKKIDNLENYDNYNNFLKYPVKKFTIKTNDKTIFYLSDKELFSSNKEYELEVVMEDDKYHYVILDNNVYQVNKEIVVRQDKEIKKEYLEKISVFFFDNFSNLNEKLSYLKEQNYKSITPDDLKLFLNGNVELDKNSVLLFYNKNLNLSDVDTLGFDFYLQDDSEIEFKSGDSQVTRKSKSYTWYKVDKNTKLSRFKDMLVGKKEVKVTTTNSPNSNVAVLNYHFFYSSKNGEVCNESICLDTRNFEEQLKYLKDNNIDTLTMQEYVDWIYGRKTLTKKSVLITIDDGAMGTNNHLPDLLDKYNAKATLFLISGWWSMSKYRTGNLEIQSHTHDLHHNNYKRDGKTGVKSIMIPYDELMTDLKLSVETVGTNLAFCYPFYAYNNTLVQAVKDTGFQVAFVGGNKKSTRNSDKYKIPRYIIYKGTSLESFKKMVN